MAKSHTGLCSQDEQRRPGDQHGQQYLINRLLEESSEISPRLRSLLMRALAVVE